MNPEENNYQQPTNLPPLPEVPEFLQGDNWFEEDISGLWLDFNEPYNPPRWTLSHNGVPFANLGDLHVISGKSGHGKTSLMSMLMAALLKGEYGGFRYELKDKIGFPTVLYIDTEQGKDDSIAIKNRVCSLAGLPTDQNTEQFRFLRLRDTEDAKQRWRQVLMAIYEAKPNVIFLDGMLDIVDDYNDQKDCVPIIRKCMKVATHYNASLWCVLHENPQTDKMVGTLGSVLERKVTEVFTVRKIRQDKLPKGMKIRDDRPNIYFTVEMKKSRRYDQEDWEFEVISGANGWGVPQEFDIKMPDFNTDHTPEEVQEWIESGQHSITWPATRTDIYNNIFARNGVTDENEQKELMKMCFNRRFFFEQEKSEMTEGQRVPRVILNDEIIRPL
jgi:hypothetical protein